MPEEITNDNKKRLQWLDIMKGLLIFFVMVDHSLPGPMTERFYSPFFLAMFFWVGGYTFSLKDSFKTFIISKIQHLVIPLFVLGGMRVIIICIMVGFGSLPERLLGLVLQRCLVNDEMWFLSCLFVAELTMYFLLKFLNRIKEEKKRYCLLLLSELLLMVIGCVITGCLRVKLIWEIETAFIMVFYTGCGYVWRRSEKKAEILLKLPVVLAFLAAYVALWFFIRESLYKPRLSDIEGFPMFFLKSLLMMPVIIYITRKLEGSLVGRVSAFLGVNTLFFFAFGGFGRELFYMIMAKLGMDSAPWQAFACAVFILCLMSGPAVLFKKLCPFAVGVKRKKIKN